MGAQRKSRCSIRICNALQVQMIISAAGHVWCDMTLLGVAARGCTGVRYAEASQLGTDAAEIAHMSHLCSGGRVGWGTCVGDRRACCSTRPWKGC